MSQQQPRTKLTLMVDFLGLKKTTEVNEAEDFEYIKDIVRNILLDDTNAFKFDYQNAYNKIYNICLSGLSNDVCESLTPVIEDYFQSFEPSLNSLEDFDRVCQNIKYKFHRLNGLLLTLNEFEASSRFYLKDYGLSFLKEFIDIPSVKHRVYEVFFEELKEQRESFINKDTSSCDVGNIKKFLENMQDLLQTPSMIYQQLVLNFKTMYEDESKGIVKHNGFVNYYSTVLLLYKHEYSFLNEALGLKEEYMKSILELFADLFIVKHSSMLLSEAIFVSMTSELFDFKINNKYLIDYIYNEDNSLIINNLYKMYLNQTLMSQIFQIETQNIKNRKEYTDILSKLTSILLKLYEENLVFAEEKLKSTNNVVNRSLKLVLVDFCNTLINNDNFNNLNVEQNQWFMILIKYIDLYLISNRETSNKNIENKNMTLTVKILDGLSEERYETFILEYDSLLNKRLMSNQGTNIELEQNIIKIMDTNMNIHHGRNKEDITRMGLKIKDYLSSKRTNDKYAELATGANSDVKVLNEFFWTALVDNDNHKLSNIVIPSPLLDYIKKFETFYQKSYNTRNIKWLYQYWQIDFDHVFNHKVYTLSMPFVSTIIFYHLTENEYVTVKMLKQLTNLPTKQIVQNLITFSIKYNLIIHLDNNKNLSLEKKAINEGDYFTINNDFVSPNAFVKVNVISITRKEGSR